MSPHRSELLCELDARGFIHQVTDAEGLDELAATAPVVAYIGFDCTADSLHVGHLVSVMMLRWLQRLGHEPIALVGGGTTKVGDPSFRDEARPLLSDADIEHNKAGIKRGLSAFLDFEDGSALMVDNADWLDQLRYIPFLRDFGTHFTINRMLTFDSVRMRLEREQPLTLLEFNYMVMQAYDFLELSRRYGCRLQMGGSDQWGNIVNGVELGRRIDRVHLFGLTTPLLTTTSGHKMGKTAAGAVWLNPDRLSDFDYWQYWRNVEDADVGRFLRLFTELPLDEIARLEALQGAEINEAKKRLATEATRLCRGDAAAAAAGEGARRMFAVTVDLVPGRARGIGQELIVETGKGLPSIDIARSELVQGLSIVDLFQRSGLVASKGEARRLIRGGGARLNGERIGEETRLVDMADLQDGELTLSSGKKRHVVVRAA